MFSLLFVAILNFGHAEYRVYQLKISNGTGAREVLSTLDDLQYPEYYPLRSGESINYLDSWMCYRRSDYFASYCPKPTPSLKTPPKSNSQAAPASPSAASSKP
jgi:hypothetical protein